MMNKGQKHKSKNTKSTKNYKKHAKAKTKNKPCKFNYQNQNEEERKKRNGQGGEWCPVVSGALCMGVRSAQFESCMKPGVRFMELSAVPWIGW